ncbi:DUF4893 domain-containing protein [Sphingomonas sp. HDW15A]|uniref:DUF4893 domain-containing protein n=1 Tax=Sphingomonas sp. HDW15A TaxID=2714942 RepID=UPI00140E30A6|nr:DUF4893 domain-containing protein [Sphingomonas sp. HDW15A]QIK95254.1 DUF4893 domain-containing protein [Sphingomonas sp. HDW15A]
MMSVRITSIFAIAALAAGCADLNKQVVPPVPIVAPPTKAEVWQGIASQADRDRLANVSGAWAAGLAAARKSFATAIREEGALLRQDAAQVRPAPTPGSYSCRLVILGELARANPRSSGSSLSSATSRPRARF